MRLEIINKPTIQETEKVAKFELDYSENGCITLTINGWNILKFHPDGKVTAYPSAHRLKKAGFNCNINGQVVVKYEESA